ncbi:Major membrane immunogen, membrane-anchored lipoprotein [Ruminococcaceae bacterium FB2012]|nr:Major membrane immunogen, membrane-anchored lipoprotein [Ruminococcaceae bacterium FB2012]
MKKIIVSVLAALCAVSFASCGSKTYKDGTYTGKSAEFSEDQEGGGSGYGEVTLTIKDGKVTECKFETFELDGTPKGEDYGKEGGEIKNRDYYNKAQKANAARAYYAAELVNKGNTDEIDAVSGATINFDQFKQAVAVALSEAEK